MNMYTKVPFRTHISHHVYPKHPFRAHIVRVILQKCSFEPRPYEKGRTNAGHIWQLASIRRRH